MQSMQLTDWLVVIFIVALVAVFLDGVRRKFVERRNRVVLKLDKNLPRDGVDPDDLPNSELPNGGARTLDREGKPIPSLRTLQSKRKLSFRATRSGSASDEPGVRAVPVLLDAVDVEEERIEHTNVSAQAFDGSVEESFEESFEESVEELDEDDVDELIGGLDEEYEEDAMLGEQTITRKQPGYMDTRYQGRDDDDDDLDDEEEFEDDDEEDEEEFEEFDEEIASPEELDDEDDEDDDDDDLDDDDEDDLDDDFDDDEEEEEEDDDEEDEEDLDELEGLPEDDWGSDEEQDVLVDDYESEPVLLQGAYDKAASQFTKAASQLDKAASHAASQFDKAASHAVSHFNRPPREKTPRVEPGFGGSEGTESAAWGDERMEEFTFSEDFSAILNEESDELQAGTEAIRPEPVLKRPAPAPAAAPGSTERPLAARKDQRELFREPEPAPAPGPQEVIIINVMARPGLAIHGGDLLSVLLQQGLRLGDMSIFHRHADSSGSGAVMFSMANMVKPGTFSLATMDQFTTPGVSFFMQIPNKLGNMACFDKMLGAAAAVRDAFDADLKDENRSVFTRQTVEHCRQRIRDFELKLLSRK